MALAAALKFFKYGSKKLIVEVVNCKFNKLLWKLKFVMKSVRINIFFKKKNFLIWLNWT